MVTQAEHDASFFSLAHEVIEAAKQRAPQRECYGAQQLIAPYVEGRMPAKHEFRPVRCMSISLQAMTFLGDKPAQDGKLLVLLRSKPPIFLVAEVTNQVPDGDEYAITCHFTGRLS